MGSADSGNGERDDVIVVPGELTISVAAEYYNMLMDRAAKGGDITLDGGSVSRIDAAGVQLLFVIQRALAEAGNTLRWNGVSQALEDAFTLLGIAGCKGLPGET